MLAVSNGSSRDDTRPWNVAGSQETQKQNKKTAISWTASWSFSFYPFLPCLKIFLLSFESNLKVLHGMKSLKIWSHSFTALFPNQEVRALKSGSKFRQTDCINFCTYIWVTGDTKWHFLPLRGQTPKRLGTAAVKGTWSWTNSFRTSFSICLVLFCLSEAAPICLVVTRTPCCQEMRSRRTVQDFSSLAYLKRGL